MENTHQTRFQRFTTRFSAWFDRHAVDFAAAGEAVSCLSGMPAGSLLEAAKTAEATAPLTDDTKHSAPVATSQIVVTTPLVLI